MLLFAFAAGAQQNKHNGYVDYGNNVFYSAGGGNGFGFGLSLTVDKFTKTVNYSNAIPNQPLSNLVYLEGSREINLFGYLNKDSLSFYRYTVTENDTAQIVSDAIPNTLNIKSPSENRIQVGLGKFNVANKKLTINLYKITRRSEVATIIIYNKIIQPAFISFFWNECPYKKRWWCRNEKQKGFGKY